MTKWAQMAGSIDRDMTKCARMAISPARFRAETAYRPPAMGPSARNLPIAYLPAVLRSDRYARIPVA
jgi:hypothetical protein